MGRGKDAGKETRRRKPDMKKTVAAILANGLTVRGVRVHADGSYTVLVGPDTDGDTVERNEWDSVLNQ